MKKISHFLITLTFLLQAGPVCFAAEKPQIININTVNSSIVLRVSNAGAVEFRHYGAKIADNAAFASLKSGRHSTFGTEPLAYPVAGGRNVALPALSIQYPDGETGTVLTYKSHRTEKIADKVTRTTVVLEDPANPVTVSLVYTAYEAEDVITIHSEISNTSKKNITLLRYYSSAVQLPRDKYLLTHFHGFGNYEMQLEQEMLTHGVKSIVSTTGTRACHVANPSFLLSAGTENYSEKYGEVYAGALAWNGNYDISFNLDETGSLEILSGMNPESSPFSLHRGETLSTPEMVYTYSSNGAGQVTRNLHDWARNHWCYAASSMCPTLLNSWEGAYFKINDQVLEKMVDNAARMGLEMFVVDDGWFGGKDYPRNSANQGLGDWEPIPDKFSSGMRHIAEYTRSKGLKFGIWIEPEMVNPQSHLAQSHPDWIVKPIRHEATLYRNQLVLDLCNPAVQDFVFGVFDKVMTETGADYIKWDCNRNLEEVHSTVLTDQGRFVYEYQRGLDKVMDRVRAKYPNVMIQACAGGGGRVNYASLKIFNEFWTSDGTDGLSRCFIQYATDMIYPALATAAHVSAAPNHQTGNITPLKFRFDLASTGRLGMELQPADMTEDELSAAKGFISNYYGFRDIVAEGDLYRLSSPYDSDQYSLMYVSKDKRRAVFFCFNLKYQTRVEPLHIRMDGLERGAKYSLKELGVKKSKFWGDGRTLSSEFLMDCGVNPPMQKLYESCIYYLEKVNQ